MADYRKDVKIILKELERQGFRIREGRHYVIYPPDRTKHCFAVPRSPSDWRGMKNLIRDLKSLGFIPPPGGELELMNILCAQ